MLFKHVAKNKIINNKTQYKMTRIFFLKILCTDIPKIKDTIKLIGASIAKNKFLKTVVIRISVISGTP